MNDNSSRVIEVDINEILPNRFQPRIQFDEDEILELSDSIKEHGVIQPIVVRTIGDKYEIIAGERRYKASVLAGKETVPVIIKNLNDKDSAEVALIENIQRKNLTPIEEALSYKKILDMGYITQENLASKLGKSQSSVANKIRLLNLSDQVQEALLENKISERHARSLLKLSTSELQNKMLDKIINERLTVRKTDEEINKININTESEGNDDSKKILEKGENEMNNNLNTVNNTNPQPQIFDIFGRTEDLKTTPATPSVSQPVAPSFDIFSQPSAVSVQPVKPEAQSEPAVSGSAFPSFELPQVPVMPETQMKPEIQPEPAVSGSAFPSFELPQVPVMPEAQMKPEMQPEPVASSPVFPSFELPQTPVMPEAQVKPEIQSEPAVSPVFPSFELPQVPVMPEAQVKPPVVETPQVSSLPETSPIIETPINIQKESIGTDNLFSFAPINENNNLETINSIPTTSSVTEFKIPEPIIITDYNKQYDPVMPQSEVVQPTKVDFKEVINAIRECSRKIEQYGFKIDVEEYDLANLYQVIFKIEK